MFACSECVGVCPQTPTFLKLTTICEVSHLISFTRPSSPLFFSRGGARRGRPGYEATTHQHSQALTPSQPLTSSQVLTPSQPLTSTVRPSPLPNHSPAQSGPHPFPTTHQDGQVLTPSQPLTSTVRPSPLPNHSPAQSGPHPFPTTHQHSQVLTPSQPLTSSQVLTPSQPLTSMVRSSPLPNHSPAWSGPHPFPTTHQHGQVLTPSQPLTSTVRSSSVMWKSNTSPYSRIFSGLKDLGRHT